MWLFAVSVPLLPALLMVSRRCRVKVSSLCRRALNWALGLVQGRACVRSTHAFVFSNCTHGKVDSVLQTFDLYAETRPSLSIGPETGEALDDVVRRVRPSRALELGTHCGYSSVRLLRLLPPAGRLITVELDPLAAELGEEIILVAGFKHSQVLTSPSAEAIPALRSRPGPDQRGGGGFELVLMDHDPRQYLPDLLALERDELLCRSGCSVLLVNRRRRAEDLGEVLDHIRARAGRCCSIRTELPFMVEIFYQKENTETEGRSVGGTSEVGMKLFRLGRARCG
ncbi:putative catechol O-methyltransferase-like [Scophthalmus maximus]|uniref:catechol O-methyltransferase n=1 Tax=Scophthalmus maximus TaxID=52904 RepID=A0A2U9C548_SCOMX|nr:putative catechol O-methyltransferase-like [Scophthalmus maximus]